MHLLTVVHLLKGILRKCLYLERRLNFVENADSINPAGIPLVRTGAPVTHAQTCDGQREKPRRDACG